jgi:hypothetical protein
MISIDGVHICAPADKPATSTTRRQLLQPREETHAPADKRLHNNFVPRTPKIPPPYPGALCVDGHDLFILMSVNTVIELDDHPHSMETRPGLQKKEIGYFKSNTH